METLTRPSSSSTTSSSLTAENTGAFFVHSKITTFVVQAGAENAEEGWEGRICVRDLRRRRPEEDLALHSDCTLLLRFSTQGLHTGGIS